MKHATVLNQYCTVHHNILNGSSAFSILPTFVEFLNSFLGDLANDLVAIDNDPVKIRFQVGRTIKVKEKDLKKIFFGSRCLSQKLFVVLCSMLFSSIFVDEVTCYFFGFDFSSASNSTAAAFFSWYKFSFQLFKRMSSKRRGINGTLVYENEDAELLSSFVQRGEWAER